MHLRADFQMVAELITAPEIEEAAATRGSNCNHLLRRHERCEIICWLRRRMFFTELVAMPEE